MEFEYETASNALREAFGIFWLHVNWICYLKCTFITYIFIFSRGEKKWSHVQNLSMLKCNVICIYAAHFILQLLCYLSCTYIHLIVYAGYNGVIYSYSYLEMVSFALTKMYDSGEGESKTCALSKLKTYFSHVRELCSSIRTDCSTFSMRNNQHGIVLGFRFLCCLRLSSIRALSYDFQNFVLNIRPKLIVKTYTTNGSVCS